VCVPKVIHGNLALDQRCSHTTHSPFSGASNK